MEDLLEWKKPSDRDARAGGMQSPGLQGVPVRLLAKEETEEKISVGGKRAADKHSFRQGGFEVPGRNADMRKNTTGILQPAILA